MVSVFAFQFQLIAQLLLSLEWAMFCSPNAQPSANSNTSLLGFYGCGMIGLATLYVRQIACLLYQYTGHV